MDKSPFKINHNASASQARVGQLQTAHGMIDTPVFMPVGTLGTVKGVEQSILEEVIDAQIILGNTYHLYLRPGLEILQEAGGLHAFIDWKRPMLTDSGGYQVYSLAKSRKIKDEGVTFSSHIDGSKHLFTPENVVETQRIIGADIMMAFDECTPYPCELAYAKKSLQLTHRWVDRCMAKFAATDPLYGHEQIFAPIVQGSVYPDLRREAAQHIADLGAHINAIGGLSVGEPADLMYEMTEICTAILPADRPRYLMGVGTPANLLECIDRGIDMFDCVLPTRNARHGLIYTSEGQVNIRNRKWATCHDPIDANGSRMSQRYSKAYLRHLIMCKEMLGAQLASMQNLHFYQFLMKQARIEIANDTFSSWKDEMITLTTTRL